MSYRRLTGALLLWAILPMPFLYVILPPFWIAAAAAAAAALWRPNRSVRLAPWLLNLIAVAIVVIVVLTGGLRVGPVRPLGHLLLLLTAVRSLVVDDRESFFRVLPPVFLLWLMAVASSTHVILVPYLVLSVAVWWWAGMALLLLGMDPERRWTRADLPQLGHVVKAAVLVVLIAIPIFVAMPRLRSPWVAGQSVQRSSGFSNSVELSRRGNINTSRELALVINAPPGQVIEQRWTRLRATAFNMVFAGSWAPRRVDESSTISRTGLLWLDEEGRDLERSVQLSIELLRPRGYLFVPDGAVAVSAPVPVSVDPVGGLAIDDGIRTQLRYSVWVKHEATARFDAPASRDTYLPKRDSEVRAMAVQVAGDLNGAARRAAAVESFLERNYEYSLDTSGVTRSDPVAWFLLDGGRGHCEFFAGAMVVLLRHLDIPARLVAGYNGGSLAPSGASVAVRQANAHTWVEVWLGPERGWAIYDPTPDVGVPELVGQTGLERLRWLWQRVQDSWDRYVLTFGLSEQTGLLTRIADLLARWRAGLGWRHLVPICVLVVGLWLVRRGLGSGWKTRNRGDASRSPAARMVERLARRLSASGVEVPPRATVRWIGAAAGERWPESVAAVDELVVLAEHELYAAAPRSGSDRRSRQLWSALRRSTAAAQTRSGDDGLQKGL